MALGNKLWRKKTLMVEVVEAAPQRSLKMIDLRPLWLVIGDNVG